MKKVMVFGVFDGLHKGHDYFLGEAKKLADYLIAVIPNDDIVEKIKGRPPEKTFQERVKHIKNEDYVDEVVPSDASLNNWGILEKHKPDIIALGYDQTDLKIALEKYLERARKKMELKVIESFKPNKYKSSIINN